MPLSSLVIQSTADTGVFPSAARSISAGLATAAGWWTKYTGWLPPAIALAEEAGRFPTAPRYDGYVALGTVIRGETYHFEIVSDQSAAGIMALGVKGVIIGNGILTTEDEDQAWYRARLSEGDKGGGAAKACLDLIALKKRLRHGVGA